MSRPILAFDSGSPLASVALGLGDQILASRAEWIARSSTRLLQLIREVLDQAGIEPKDLGGLLALSGPGSFTGLRIGLSTAFGLHQALGIRAAAVPTLEVLAIEASESKDALSVVAAVDALRGEWSVQKFDRGADGTLRAQGDIEIVAADDLGRFAPATLTGFGVGKLASLPPELDLHTPGPLAPATLRWAALREPAWNALALCRPLYARPPAATLPSPRPRTPAPSPTVALSDPK